MRDTFPDHVEQGRFTTGDYATNRGDKFGAFRLRCPATGTLLRVLVSDGEGLAEVAGITEKWEHVSVSTDTRCPTWEDMQWMKEQFWDSHECVVQYHPPESDYVDQHRFCLHLWRPESSKIPMPPRICV